MFRIAICDEMQSQATELAQQLGVLAGEISLECQVEVFRSFKQLQKAMSESIYQLLFLETRVGGISGIDYARRLRLYDEETDIVFWSSEADSALAAYAAYPVGYLTKPVDRRKLREIFRHVAQKHRRKPSIVLRGSDGGRRMIGEEDILYIEVFDEELDVHCKRGVVHCSGSLVEVGGLLTSSDFYRSHRSFLVNLRYAVGIERYQLRMINGDTVAVARSRYAEVKAALEAYVGTAERQQAAEEDGDPEGSTEKEPTNG